jgi:hypothetical protein
MQDNISIITESEIQLLFENVENLENFVDRTAGIEIFSGSEIDLLEGQTLLSLLESQIPSNSAEIISRSNQSSLISEGPQMPDIFNSIQIKLQRLQDYVTTKVEILQSSSEV